MKAQTAAWSIAGAVLLGLLAWCCWPRGGGANEVLVLCAASMRGPMDEVVRRYNAVSTDRVVCTYGGSGELCAQLQNSGRGDLYVCHDPFMPWASRQGLVAQWQTVAFADLVLVVPKGNPKDLRTLEDLARPGLRLGVGDRKSSTSGYIIQQMFNKLPCRERLWKNATLETKGHQPRCTDVELGNLDASLVWNGVAFLYRDRLDMFPVPRDNVDAVTSATYGVTDLRNIKITVGLTHAGAQRDAARRFYEYVGREAASVFGANGFRPAKE